MNSNYLKNVMNNTKLFLVAATILIPLATGWMLFSRQGKVTNTDSKYPSFAVSPSQPEKGSDANNQTDTSGKTFINIYMVALDDNGRSGKKIGCGDSLVPVKREISNTKGVLVAALSEQLAQKDRYFGESGLYNALANSSLRVEKASIANGVATVNLSGVLSLGGVCDDPRVEEMLMATALQFPTIKEAKFFLNDVPLHEALSEK